MAARGTLPLLLLLSACPALAQDHAVRVAIKEVDEAHAGIAAFEAAGDVVLPAGSFPWRCRYLAPNHFLLEVEGTPHFGATGRRTWVVEPGRRTWQATEAADGQPIAVDLFPWCHEEFMALSLARWRKAPASWCWAGGAARTRLLEGKPGGDLVLGLEPVFQGSATHTIRFGPDRRLKETTGCHTLRLKSFRTDVALKPADFAWTPPAGHKRVWGRPPAVGLACPRLTYTDLAGVERSLREQVQGGPALVFVCDPFSNAPWRTFQQVLPALRDKSFGLPAKLVVLFWDYVDAGRDGMLAQLEERKFTPAPGVVYGTNLLPDGARAELAPASPTLVLLDGAGRVRFQTTGWNVGLVADVAAAAALLPKQDDLLVDLALQAWRDGRLTEAKDQLLRHVELRPGDARGHLYLAWFLARVEEPGLRDAARAAKAAEESIRLTGERTVNNLEVLADACALEGDFERSASILTEAIGLVTAADHVGQVAGLHMRRALAGARRHLPRYLARTRGAAIDWDAAPVRRGAKGKGWLSLDTPYVGAAATGWRATFEAPAGIALRPPAGLADDGCYPVDVEVGPDVKPGVHVVRLGLAFTVDGAPGSLAADLLVVVE